jgi:hypothetical protein
LASRNIYPLAKLGEYNFEATIQDSEIREKKCFPHCNFHYLSLFCAIHCYFRYHNIALIDYFDSNMSNGTNTIEQFAEKQ